MNPLFRQLLDHVYARPCFSQQLCELAERLDASPAELAAVVTDPKYSYHSFAIRKRSGGRRRIDAPSSPLKSLQRRLLHKYLVQLPVHTAATAFRRRHSVATHARRHLGQEVLLTADLVDFFSTTSSHRVRSWFRRQGWREDSLDVLMRLCTYRGGLPQGAPTSPALSNLVNFELDVRLSELATMHGARYSRYCDDLAFSWSCELNTAGFREQLQDRIGLFGYRLQEEKGWREQRLGELPEVTGVVLSRYRLRIPERIAKRIRSLSRRRFWLTLRERRRLHGLIGFRKMLRR